MKTDIVRVARTASVRLLVAAGCIASLFTASAEATTYIMPLGDSITQGGKGNSGPYAYASYRYALYFKLQAAGYDVNFTGSQSTIYYGNLKPNTYPNYSTTFDRDHEAWWGKTSGYLNTNLNTWLATPANAIKPDIVILNIGTNDAVGGIADATYQANLNGIIDKLRVANPNVTVVLSNLMGITKHAAKFVSKNNIIVQTVAAKNTATSRVILADIATNFPMTTLYDEIHPNEVGEEFIAQVYFNTLTSLLSGTPSAPAGSVTVDNAQTADVTLIGSWNASTVAPGYYGTNYIHDNNTGKGTKAAMFMPTLPGGGDYLVYTRWIADSNRATNVPVDIVTTTGTSTVTVNQQTNGGVWNLLGLHTFSAATAEVTFRNAGTNGYVFADVVRLVPGTGVTVDNTDATVTLVGAWSASTGTPGYLGSNYFHDGATGKGTKSVSFKPAVPSTGNYLVFARWPAEVNRATNVPVDIVTSNGTTTTVTVNQQQNSNTWNLLGTYPLAAANAEVKFRTTGTTDYVVADGVRIVPAPVQ